MVKGVTVIGAGPGGYVCAARAAQLGADVTLVEMGPIGGTCLNRGCIPTKSIRACTKMAERFRQASSWGIDLKGEVMPRWDVIGQRTQRIVGQLTQGIERMLKQQGVEIVRGQGRIKGPGKVEVRAASGEVLQLDTDYLVLAMGSSPAQLPNIPVDGETVITSDHFFAMEEVPKSVLVLGAGVVGCELSFILAALDSRVILVEAMDRVLPLPGMDPQHSKVLQREMRKRGIQVILNATVVELERVGGVVRAKLGDAGAPMASQGQGHNAGPGEISAQKVLVCVGRRPNTSGMGLEEAGVRMDERGWIEAGADMRTSVDGVFAVGDVLGPSRWMLAHVAMKEGVVAAENAMGLGGHMDYHCVPLVAYTEPEVASVGLTEPQAEDLGMEVDSASVLVRVLGRAQAEGEIAGEGKVVFQKGTKKVVGVHIIGPWASELITQGALAVKWGASLGELTGVMAPHPSFSELMVEIYHKAAGCPIHGA